MVKHLGSQGGSNVRWSPWRLFERVHLSHGHCVASVTAWALDVVPVSAVNGTQCTSPASGMGTCEHGGPFPLCEQVVCSRMARMQQPAAAWAYQDSCFRFVGSVPRSEAVGLTFGGGLFAEENSS